MERNRALQRACGFLQERLAGGYWRQGDRLPPVRSLAREMGVSLVTAVRAIGTLVNSGVLVSVPRSGVVVAARRGAGETGGGRPRQASAIMSSTAPRWRKVRHLLFNDLVCGIFPQGQSLPTLKVLGARYGTSYRVMKAAVESLVDERMLEPYCRSYRVRQLAVSLSRHPALTVVVESSPRQNVKWFSPWYPQFLQHLENECARVNIRVHFLTYRDLADGVRLKTLEGKDMPAHLRADPPLGTCLLATSSTELSGLFRTLLGYGRPVAVFDIGGEFVPEVPSGVRVPVAVVTASVTATAARAVGYYLAENGHTGAAFISPFHAAEWSRERLRGLDTALSMKAGGCAVPFALDNYATDWDFVLKGEWRSRIQPYFVVQNGYARGQSPAFKRYVKRQQVLSPLGIEEAREACTGLFDAAAARGDLTAWVCANDLVALFALDYARDHGIKVPRDLSIVGFDNTAESLFGDLTSYHFDMAAAARAVVDFVVSPGSRAEGQRRIEIAGTLIERGSSTARGRGGRSAKLGTD